MLMPSQDSLRFNARLVIAASIFNPGANPKQESPLVNTTWVVYKLTNHKYPTGINSVCEQREWDALELAQPGIHTLVQAGFASEGAAEQVARGTAGDGRRTSYPKR